MLSFKKLLKLDRPKERDKLPQESKALEEKILNREPGLGLKSDERDITEKRTIDKGADKLNVLNDGAVNTVTSPIDPSTRLEDYLINIPELKSASTIFSSKDASNLADETSEKARLGTLSNENERKNATGADFDQNELRDYVIQRDSGVKNIGAYSADVGTKETSSAESKSMSHAYSKSELMHHSDSRLEVVPELDVVGQAEIDTNIGVSNLANSVNATYSNEGLPIESSTSNLKSVSSATNIRPSTSADITNIPVPINPQLSASSLKQTASASNLHGVTTSKSGTPISSASKSLNQPTPTKSSDKTQKPEPMKSRSSEDIPKSTSPRLFGFSLRKLSGEQSKSPTSQLTPTTSNPSEKKKPEKSSWFKSKHDTESSETESVTRSRSASDRSRKITIEKNERAKSAPRSKTDKKVEDSVTSIKTKSSAAPAVEKPRFKMLENGKHEHHLKAIKGEEKLSHLLKDFLGGQKVRDEAISATPPSKKSDSSPNIFGGLAKIYHKKDEVRDTSVLENVPSDLGDITTDTRSFAEKYGRCQEVAGRGSYGVVRISHKKIVDADDTSHITEKLFAVKEFKKKDHEVEANYIKRTSSEYVISSSLKAVNIIDTLDLLKDKNDVYCVVMDYCSGGDLYTLILSAGKLEYAEADCFFKQLIHGITYMHSMGIAHRDLKPENLVITQDGVLKITDFGNSECFKVAWDPEIQLSSGICGSAPYIAPEEFTQKRFDPQAVDIWSCGIIYMAMRTGRQLWKVADPTKDELFQEYLEQRIQETGFDPIEQLKRARCRNVIYSVLNPKPERRITGKQILSSEWGREIKVCDAGEGHVIAPPPENKIEEEEEEGSN